MITYYESGRMVPPVIALHEGGAIKAYYPRLDEIRAVQGLGWWWYPDGKPHAAIHWEKSQKSGPALFLAPDGSVDRENTKIYALTE